MSKYTMLSMPAACLRRRATCLTGIAAPLIAWLIAATSFAFDVEQPPSADHPPPGFARPFQACLSDEARRQVFELHRAAVQAEAKGDYPEALRCNDECVKMLSAELGSDHWLTVARRVSGDGLRRSAALSDEDRQVLRQQKARELLVMRYGSAGRPDLAVPECRKIFDARSRLLGEDHPDTVQAQGDLAINLRLSRSGDEALKTARDALGHCQRLYGPDHPITADTLVEVASNLQQMGRLEEALQMDRQAMRVLMKTAGYEERTFNCIQETALVLYTLSRYSEAECLVRCVLQGRSAPGMGGINVEQSHEALATILMIQGRPAEAEEHLRKAMASYEHTQDRHGRNLASCRLNLARLLRETPARMHEAATLLHTALEDVNPDDPLMRGFTCLEIGNLQRDLRSYDEAKRHHQAAAESFLAAQGKLGFQTIESLMEMAHDVYMAGDFNLAGNVFPNCADLNEKLLGRGNAATARAYLESAQTEWARGDLKKAEEYAEKAADAYHRIRLSVSASGLERSTVFQPIPERLLAILSAERRPAEAFEHLENSLARGLSDELAGGRSEGIDPADLARRRDLNTRLQQVSTQIAACRAAKGAGEAVTQRLDELIGRRNSLEQDLAVQQQFLGQKYGVAAGKVCGWKEIQSRLAADTALLGWVELCAPSPHEPRKAEVWAVVLRSTDEPAWIRLQGSGPDGAWTSDDLMLPLKISQAFREDNSDVREKRDSMLQTLRRQRFEPVEKRLQSPGGVSPVRRLLVLPSQWMSSIPVDLLAPQYAAACVPSGSVFAWLRGRDTGPRRQDRPERRVLALGDPDLTLPAWSSKPGDQAAKRLPYSGIEAKGIGRLYPDSTVLVGKDASQRALEDLADSGRLGRFKYLHLASHCHVDQVDPSRTYLLLSVAGLPDPAEQLRHGDRAYTGYLTTAEIRRTWKLNADLIVLSACNSGAGVDRGGEGHLGFSQVLLMAGSRSCLLTLWSCNDAAGALLMMRFHENLSGKRAGLASPLPKAEALVEAKRWLRNLSSEEVDSAFVRIAGSHWADELDRRRDLDLPDVDRAAPSDPQAGPRPRQSRPKPSAKLSKPFADPFFWAGFVLIGDPD